MRVARFGFVFVAVAALALVAGPARAENSEIGIEIGAVAPDDLLTGDDGDSVSPSIGFKFVNGIGDAVGWFGGLNYFTADRGAFGPDPSVFTLRGGAEWFLNPVDARGRWFLDFGGGLSRYDGNSVKFNRPIATLALGQRFQVGENNRLGWEIRADQDLNDDGPVEDPMLHLHALVAFAWGSTAPPADTDGDGVIDRKDACPDTPRGAVVDERGCPKDSDGDGVWDGIDQCPDTPAGWPVDARGCPKDSDGDGVPDGKDRCPDTPKGATVDENGCPKDSDGDGVWDGIDQCPDTPKGATVDAKGCPKDSDGDGVYDGIDQCPDTPKGATVDAKGCPKDSDGDGVWDGIDQCPDTPKGAPVDAKGCPKLAVESRGAFVLRGVNFELNSAKLTADSTETLDLVAQTLAAYANVRVEIGGHTDTQGSAAYNAKLSERRAQSVKDYLVGKGIDASRLTVKGYGEASPIAPGNTADAHAQNRRVELKRID